MTSYVQPPNEPIAIVGSGCRLPGSASSPSRLWDLLHSPRDVSRRVPERSFNPDGFYHPDGEHHGASNVTKSYFLDEDPRLFDSAFFNITPREAETIDPQQRLLLETVFEAMESGGLDMKSLQGSQTSAYVGIMTNDFTDTQVRRPCRSQEDGDVWHILTILPTRPETQSFSPSIKQLARPARSSPTGCPIFLIGKALR